MASTENLNDHHTSGSFPVDPMHQFEIKKYIDLNLGGIDISFTNSSLFMLIAVTTISFFLIENIIKKLIVVTAINIKSEELVKDISIPPKFKSMYFFISN
jgi:hypothetical protein